MKTKNLFYLLSFLFFIGLLACQIQDASIEKVEIQLMKKLLETEEAKSTRINGRVVIAKELYCEQNDCELIFKDFQAQVQFFGREDLFMRNDPPYLVISLNKEEATFSVRRVQRGRRLPVKKEDRIDTFEVAL